MGSSLPRAIALGMLAMLAACDGGTDPISATDAGALADAGTAPRDAAIEVRDAGSVRPDGGGARARVLLVTCSSGFQHGAVTRGGGGEPSVVETAIGELAAELEADVTTLYDPAELAATPATTVSTFDAFVFYTTGELPFPDETRDAIIARIAAGAGLLGIHSATDTWRAWTPWSETLGATQYGDGPEHPWCECHPWAQSVGIVVEDTASPIVAHLGTRWTVTDEIYQFEDFSRDRVHVLLSLDTSTVDVSRASRTDGDFALGWTRVVGTGRVVYVAIGHEPALFADLAYRSVLREGLRFAIGR